MAVQQRTLALSDVIAGALWRCLLNSLHEGNAEAVVCTSVP